MPTLTDDDKRRLEIALRPESGQRIGNALDAIEAANSDVQIAIPLLRGLTDTSTVVWTPTVSTAGVRALTRTAGSTDAGVWFEVPHRNRTTASKGFKPTGVKASYSVGTTIADDVQFVLYKRTIPATGSAPGTPAIIAGQTNSEYDTDHDTVAERVAAGNHTLMMTVPSAAQAYIGDGEEYLVCCVVASATHTGSVFALLDLVVLGTEALTDLT